MSRYCIPAWMFFLGVSLTACRGGTEKVDPATAELIRTVLREQIEAASSSQGGYLFPRPDLGRTETLSFDYVHQDVNRRPDGTYYACVNFLSPAGDTLDVDLFVRPSLAGYEVEREILHKVNGKLVPGYEEALGE